MIFIGIDVSKTSTALCIENNNIIKLFSYTIKKDNNCWIKDTSDFINYRHIIYKYMEEKDYSKSEIIKIKEFDVVSNLILNDIFDNINILDGVKIAIEGYSYNSKRGPIIDIVEFTTILKHKLLIKLNSYSNIQIVSPLTLKSECCKMIYESRIEKVGKRVIKEVLHYENTKGKEATKFDKWDMFYAFIDSSLDMSLKQWCKEYSEEISKNQDVPKPLDDSIDAIFLKEIMKKQYLQNINIKENN